MFSLFKLFIANIFFFQNLILRYSHNFLKVVQETLKGNVVKLTGNKSLPSLELFLLPIFILKKKLLLKFNKYYLFNLYKLTKST